MTGNPTSLAGPETPLGETTPVGQASTARRRVLIVEDNETARKQIQVFLETDPSLCVDTAANGSDALKALTERPYSVIVTDLKMPRVDGLQLIEEVQKRRLPADVIVTTGFGTHRPGRPGDAAGGLRLPDQADRPEHLQLVMERALRERALQDEVAALREQLQEHFSVPQHPQQEPADARRLRADPPHRRDQEHGADRGRDRHGQGADRPGDPRLGVDRAAARSSRSTARPCPRSLLESELFGHEKGAFTCADRPAQGAVRAGRRAAPSSSTRSATSPLAMQAKLLRVLQERRFERVGGHESIEVDVRVVAATNRDLQQDGQGGQVPRGPVLPAQRRQDRPAAAARAPRGHPAAGHPLRRRSTPGPDEPPKTIVARGDGGAAPATAGRATSASWRTPSSGPASPRGTT